MTIPFFIENPFTLQKVEVPYEIVDYCDRFSKQASRESLEYVDCIFMHMGYYGDNVKVMEEWRKSFPINKNKSKAIPIRVIPIFE